MSEADDALREMATNRGCRLVRSRVRTPGRGDYGKFGLKDAATGKDVLGIGKRGLTASAEEIEQFLRGGAAATWKSSVGKLPAKAKRAAPEPSKEKPKPEPKLIIRDAQPRDAEVLAKLIVDLGFDVTPAEIRARLGPLRKEGHPPLVAVRGDPIGCLTWHVMQVLHRPRPVGRISMLVVAEEARGQGIGAALVEAAAVRLRDAGCGLVEVTSNIKLMRAHGFYEKLGFERTSYRFVKALD